MAKIHYANCVEEKFYFINGKKFLNNLITGLRDLFKPSNGQNDDYFRGCKLNGKGVYHHVSGDRVESFFENGKPNGASIIRHRNGKIEMCYFKNGKIIR